VRIERLQGVWERQNRRETSANAIHIKILIWNGPLLEREKTLWNVDEVEQSGTNSYSLGIYRIMGYDFPKEYTTYRTN
jgi:hypothetical protein